MSMKERRVVLDVDASSGGTAAVLLAASSGRFHLEGVTTVWGRKQPAEAAAQALMVGEMLKKEFPICPGCPGPLVREVYRQAPEREDGRKPAPLLSPFCTEKHAVDYLIRQCRASTEKLTILAMGPLTNLAAAIRIAPDLLENVREIVVATGGAGGTDSAFCPEGNVFQDPEAAKIVAESGARVIFLRRNMVRQTFLPEGYAAKCRALGSPAGEFFARILEGQALAYSGPRPRRQADIAPIQAALSFAYLVDPASLGKLEHISLDICLDRGAGRGAVLIGDPHFKLKKNVWMANEADADRVGEIVLEALREAPAGQ